MGAGAITHSAQDILQLPYPVFTPATVYAFQNSPLWLLHATVALLWLPGTSGCMTAGIMRLYREQCYNPPWTVTSVLTQRNIPLAGRMSSECRNQKHFSSQYPHYNFGIIIIIIIYKTSWGDSPVIKIICCSSRGSEFCSENPLLTTSNCLEFYLQVEALFCPMLAMTYTYYILNQIHTKNTSLQNNYYLLLCFFCYWNLWGGFLAL